MQETEFIAQNKEKWKEFEDVLKSDNKDPDRLTSLFIETTDDLSYSRTFYPNRSVRVYLNGISQKIYQAIYKNKSKGKNKFKKFWQEELPSALWYSRKTLLLSFIIFSVGILIGVVSDIFYPNFSSIVLSPQYVAMTEENIASGDPMAVYKDSEPFSMFLRIGQNNIMISFGCFVLGLLWGVGTTYALLSNGVMFGAFMHFFFTRGLQKESILTVMQHGTLELSMIILSGSAGFILAKGLLFPGTYSRLDSLILSARNAIKIMIAVFVLLVYAAFIESFVTRLTDLPDAVRISSILLSLSIVIGYFVWYPYYQYKKGAIAAVENEEIPIHKEDKINLSVIKNPSKIFIETFSLFSKTAKSNALLSFGIALIMVMFYGLISHGKFNELVDFNDLEDFNFYYLIWCWTPYYFIILPEKFALLVPLMALMLALIFVATYSWSEKILFGESNWKKLWPLRMVNAFILSLFVLLPLYLEASGTFFLMIFTWPFTILWLVQSFHKNQFLLMTLIPSLSLLRNAFIRMLSVFWTVHLMQWFGILFLTGGMAIIVGFILTGKLSNFIIIIFQFISMNIPRNAPFADQSFYIFYLSLLWFCLAFMVSLSTYSSVLLFHTMKEIDKAESLNETIQQIGKVKRAYGLEKEV
jgi:uncharacterized membrane protein SpoIIM required for sporulation